MEGFAWRSPSTMEELFFDLEKKGRLLKNEGQRGCRIFIYCEPLRSGG